MKKRAAHNALGFLIGIIWVIPFVCFAKNDKERPQKLGFTIISTEPFSPFIGAQSLGLEQGFKGKFGVLLEMGQQSNFDASYFNFKEHKLNFSRLSFKYYFRGFNKSGAAHIKDNSFIQIGFVNMNQSFEKSYYDVIQNSTTHFMDTALIQQQFKIKGNAGLVSLGKRLEWNRICLELSAGFNMGIKKVNERNTGTFVPYQFPKVESSYSVFCPFLIGDLVMGVQANVKLGIRLF
ncbi:MAG: hypothetical protein KA981_07625 [Bacteroidia bacterium]|nr:hypothetical protein [Bacteroidia bacterium]